MYISHRCSGNCCFNRVAYYTLAKLSAWRYTGVLSNLPKLSCWDAAMRICFAIFTLMVGTTAFADDSWPGFRGPNGDGHSQSKTAPTKWSETENVKWKVAVHDKGWSSPIVVGEQVWVTTALENGKEFYAVCLDRKTGKTIHDLHLFSDKNPPNIRQFNSYASPTPVIDDGKIYAHFGSRGTACIDTQSGKILWSRDDLPCDHWRGPASSPIVYKDWLFLLFDGHDKQYTACLNKITGKTVWQKDRGLPYPNDGDLKKAFATASVFEIDGKPQLVTPAAVGTLGYDPATGDELWRVIHGGMNEACRPVMAHGLIYLTTGHTAGLIAVRAGQMGDLTKTGVAWRADKIAPTRPSPTIVGDLLFMVNDTGIVFCLDAKTGDKHWQERLDGKFSASPVFAGGNLYFFSEGDKSFVIAATKTYTPIATNKLDAGCKASPAIMGGNLYVRTLTHLYCIGQ